LFSPDLAATGEGYLGATAARSSATGAATIDPLVVLRFE
jgi:hypothetical protein